MRLMKLTSWALVLNVTCQTPASEPFVVPSLSANSIGITAKLASEWDDSQRVAGLPKMGVFAADVTPDGPAGGDSGILPLSWITRLNGKKVNNPDEFEELIRSSEPGKPIRIEVRQISRRESDSTLMWKPVKTLKLIPVPFGEMCLKQCPPVEGNSSVRDFSGGWSVPYVGCKIKMTDGGSPRLTWSASVSSGTGLAASKLLVAVGGDEYLIEQRTERQIRRLGDEVWVTETMTGDVDSETGRMLWDLAFGHGTAVAKWSGNLARDVEVSEQNRRALKMMLCAYLQLGGTPLVNDAPQN